MGFLKSVFSSKKAGAAIVGTLIKTATGFGLDPAVADAAVQLLLAFIVSQGAVDLGLALKGAKKE